MSALSPAARARWLALTAGLSVWAVAHLGGIAWSRFLLAFAAIDVVGYLPGALAFRAAAGRPIRPIYHHLYNLTHNFLTGAALVGLWALALGRLEWAMLSIPIHLAGDRGVFGNTLKPLDQPFERRRARVAS